MFWYFGRGMPYSVFKQKRPHAPVFFIIGGTGAGHDSVKSYGLANVLYQAGFTVISLPNPTHPSFIVTASSDSVPGQLEEDARDLYRVMGMIADQLHGEIGVTDYYVGGLQPRRHPCRLRQSARRPGETAQLQAGDNDQSRGEPLRFGQPARCHGRQQPGLGRNGGRPVYRSPVRPIDRALQSKDQIDFTDSAFLYRAYAALEPPERELQLLIGLAFRMTSNDMSFTSDVMTNAGYVVPKNAQLTATTSLTEVMLQGLRLNFVDYFDGVYVPKIQAREPGVTRQQLIDRASLRSIESYLRQDQRVVLVGTQDDVILSRAEVFWLQDVFGERARLFPTGGHCGSMDQREFVRSMLELTLLDPAARS